MTELPAVVQPHTFSIEDAIAALRTSRRTIYDLINRGELRSYTVGKRRYVTAAAIGEFIAAREATTAAERADAA